MVAATGEAAGFLGGNMGWKYITAMVALILSACAGTRWTHPTKTEREFYMDRARCMAMAKSGGGANPQIYSSPYSSPGTGFAGGFASGWNLGAALRANMESEQIFEDCMKGLGYTTK